MSEQPATCNRRSLKWTVSIPAGGSAGGFATLRASAADTHGNTVSETLTRAYALK